MSDKQFFNYLEFEKRYSPHTIGAYRNDLNQFQAYLLAVYEIKDLKEVSYIQIRSWVVHLMHNGISPRSINRKLSALKALYKHLQKRGLIEANPVKKVIAPKINKPLPVFLNEQHTQLLFENVDFGEGYAGARNQIILEILYYTGMRRAELIELKINDIDLSQQLLKVLGKGNKERLLPFGKELKLLLENFLSTRRQEFPVSNIEQLILTDKGNKLYPKFVYNIVNKYLSSVTSLKKRSPHVMRHTFATHLSDNGANLNAVKELLGHSSLASTQVYTHNSIEKLKKVYEQAHPKAK